MSKYTEGRSARELSRSRSDVLGRRQPLRSTEVGVVARDRVRAAWRPTVNLEDTAARSTDEKVPRCSFCREERKRAR